jgi:outer membrane protein assembly factor BamD (BamD/ComL family)
MNFKFLSILLIFSSLLLTSCGDNRDESIKKIKELESKLMKDSTKAKDEVSAYNLQVAYSQFQENFPEDPEAPEYLFKAADLSISLSWGESAIAILDEFLQFYPNHKRAAEALFYKGYVYDNQINDDVKAGEFYRAFLKKYPNNAFAPSVEASIKNLGKSDEELIKEFEKMNGDTAKKDTSAKSV